LGLFVNVSKSDTVELAMERAMGWRIFMYILAVVVTLFFAFLLGQIPGAPALPPGTINPPPFNIMWLIVAGIDALILWYASPYEIRFNLRKGTYSGKTGFLIFVKPFSGTFQEFYGLCIRPNKNKRGWTIGYRIELDWNVPNRGPFELISSLSLEKAQMKQQELAAKLGITQLGCEM